MSELAHTSIPAIFRPNPGHNPKSRNDRYRRVHKYVSELAAAASGQLKQALVVLRNASDELPEQLQPAAQKQYVESEFMPAAKELLCIWIHLEAIDQGGEIMPEWLVEFLKLSLHATDFVIAAPTAADVMQSHSACTTLNMLVDQSAASIATRLGYGSVAKSFAPIFAPLLLNSRATRQEVLHNALTIDAVELNQ
jgi:hypothetical protein